MSVFVGFANGRRRFLSDESGSAHIEWTLAVALVVIAAIPVMFLVGKGSETRSGEIAISIADMSLEEAETPGADAPQESTQATPDEPWANSGVETVAATATSGDGPGADLGIGFSAGVDIRAGDYRRIGARRTESAGAVLDELRRDKPVDPAGGPVTPERVAAFRPAVPDKADVFLPSLPARRVGFFETACLDPLNQASITDARFVPTEVVASGR